MVKENNTFDELARIEEECSGCLAGKGMKIPDELLYTSGSNSGSTKSEEEVINDLRIRIERLIQRLKDKESQRLKRNTK